MPLERGVSSFAIDLTRLHRRTVTSFYSNLVTRPTGRAVRMGVESQLSELDRSRPLFLSVLDFSQVRVLDYSCADEIVAKLLLRYVSGDRPVEAYFLARGLQEHHREAIEAVLERHQLLLVAEEAAGAVCLLGPSNALERACWTALAGRGRVTVAQIAGRSQLAPEVVAPAIDRLADRRVVVRLADGLVYSLDYLYGNAGD
jgi:hypothetical protein